MSMKLERLAIASVGAVVAVAIWFGWRALNWVWLRPKRLERWLREQGLNGTSYKFLFGDLKDSSNMTKQAKSSPISFSQDIVPRVMPFLHKSVNVYGKTSFTWLGPLPRVTIKNPELAKEILSKNFLFKKPKYNPLSRFLASGLAAYEDEQWAKHRKLINPAFHMEKLKHMLPAFDTSCNEMICTWEKKLSTEGYCELDVWPSLQKMSGDVISRTAFGSNYEEGRRIFQLQTEQAEYTIKAITSLYIPGWRFLPTKRNNRMKEIDREVKASLRAIIDKRLKAMHEGGGGGACNEDLLGILLESNLRENQYIGDKNKLVGMISTDEVIDECKLFYFAGQETTSALLVWTMILLSKHPYWQQLAREEVLQVFGTNKPNFDGLNRLKTVTMILNEVLRLYPPIAIINRVIHKEMKLGRLCLPARVMLSIPTIQLHHDHENWGEDAEEFNPERFSEGLSKATKNQATSFLPFGWGPCICIGQNFAMLEAKVAMAIILQRFSFELSPSYTHAPHTILTLQPQHGAHLILHKI